ncbi:DNA replication factor Dna2-domain-containing protein [Cokeromyces recurvatus]|uniref:DNA replication factor Dna2-domain-containing protein n=1 Tax=Cokeromyces recurvatus TaxID=90255 RepID=UPI002220EE79|nr:DNA replication factor Dna2-domain-containing protein [Cokeromyces recurvatus]KAI7899573.1 DNA replication factor Dna2-domain-containing protein [Cokeromyces recurvatus]
MFGDDIALEELDISAIIKAEKKLDLSSSDIFDDLPLEELGEVLNRAENTLKAPTQKAKRQKFNRYLVANVTHGAYTIDEDKYSEKILLLIEEDANSTITAKLRQEWEQTLVTIGDIVHIPYTTDIHEVIIDNQKNFIIVHPDQLISCTAVADTFLCLRKSVLQMKIKGVSEYTEALVHGNIIHRVLQNALQTNEFSVKSIKDEIKRVIVDSLEDLYALDQDEETAFSILSGYAESIYQFGTTFVNEYPKATARPSTDMGPNVSKELGCNTISICKVLDIEEHLWSPTYGLKGMVDASVQLRLSPTNKILTVPFELKTGKASRFLTNRAQTLLYTLLMSDRYDIDIGAGVLYYSKTNSLYLVPSSRNDLRSLIMSRNYLAITCKNTETLPPMIKHNYACQNCYMNDVCMIYHKAIENGTGTTSGLHKLFEEKTDHITESISSFFQHWWKLLEKEETSIDYVRKEIWRQPAEIHELSGRCLSNMILKLSACQIEPENSIWRYCFVRSPDTEHKGPIVSNISIGDPIVVSSMEGHISLSMGFVIGLTNHEIVLSLNEPLRSPPQKDVGFDALSNQSFKTFVRFKNDIKHYYSQNRIEYRIDKDEMATGMNMLRNNLVLLVTKNDENPRMQRLRDLIIDLEKPNFDTTVPYLPLTPNMNPDQRNALKRVLQAKDYSLILGMPGTGKTTTIAEIVKYLVGQNKTVLVAAYTHLALDNVLWKVRQHGIDVLRLGNIDKVMPSMRDCTFVLVGDLYQLPPIVRKESMNSGLEKSLFSILAEARPESISYLKYQYRMNREIMDVSNMLIYDGKLKCGSHKVASKSLYIPRLDIGLKSIHKSKEELCKGLSDCWLKTVLDPRQVY